MGKKRRSSGGGTTNSSRKNGKAWKKNPLDPNRVTSGKTSEKIGRTGRMTARLLKNLRARGFDLIDHKFLDDNPKGAIARESDHKGEKCC